MIYWTVLFALLSAALLKRQSAPFAVVMLLNVAANEAIVRQDGLYSWVSAVDGVTFVALASLTWFHARRWWSFLITELAFAAVFIHALYWIAFGIGLYYGHQYQMLLNSAFLLSALILVFGGYDLGRFVGSAWNSITLAYHLWACDVHSGPKPVQSRREGKR